VNPTCPDPERLPDSGARYTLAVPLLRQQQEVGVIRLHLGIWDGLPLKDVDGPAGERGGGGRYDRAFRPREVNWA